MKKKLKFKTNPDWAIPLEEPEYIKWPSKYDKLFSAKNEPAEDGPVIKAAKDLGYRTKQRGIELQEMMDKKFGDHTFIVKIGYNDHNLEESQMLMEVVSMKPKRVPIKPDWGVVEWRQFIDNEGQIPFIKVALQDIEKYHRLIFAAEYLRTFETKEDESANAMVRPVNPDWDHTQENPTQDGRTWGSIDLDDFSGLVPEGEKGLSHIIGDIKPVREQIQEQQVAVIEAHKNSLVPVNLDAVRQAQNDPYLQKWEVAQGIARKPRETWEGKLDWEMELMAKYCYGWIRDIGTVPRPYPQDMLCLFWPIPTVLENNDKANERRNEVTARLIAFWRKSVLANGTGIDLHSESYRVTLVAMKLEKLIEYHVTNYRRVDHENTLESLDTVSMSQIKAAAVEYFQAHFPVQVYGAKPGPLPTLDPPYVEYVRLCRKYDLKEGQFLHELNL